MTEQTEATIEVQGYFGPKQMTRKAYVDRWRAHAADLTHLGIDVIDQAGERAGADWDEKYNAQQRATA